MITTVTRPCKLQNPEEVQRIVDEYFQERENRQEIRELKNGDKRIYREPPSIYRLSKKLGITDDTFYRYVNDDYTGERESYNKEICSILADAKKRIIQELYDGLALGYWNERLILAQLAKFGIIGSEDSDKHVTITIQGKESWSE